VDEHVSRPVGRVIGRNRRVDPDGAWVGVVTGDRRLTAVERLRAGADPEREVDELVGSGDVRGDAVVVRAEGGGDAVARRRQQLARVDDVEAGPAEPGLGREEITHGRSLDMELHGRALDQAGERPRRRDVRLAQHRRGRGERAGRCVGVGLAVRREQQASEADEEQSERRSGGAAHRCSGAKVSHRGLSDRDAPAADT
jgi:hypothetical protein